MKVTEKDGHFGLGYHPTSRHLGEMGRKKFNPVGFSSACFQYALSVVVVDDANSIKSAISDFIRKYPHGFKLDNWTTTVVLVVFFRKDVIYFVFLIPCPYPRHEDIF